MPRTTAITSGIDKILDVVRRLGALGFAAVYTQVHGSERASALRVADLAYRFLKGEDVGAINASADAANELREKQEPNLVWVPFIKRRNPNG